MDYFFFLIFCACYLELGAGVLVEVGEKDGSKITVKSGRFGPYINWNRINTKLPEEYMEDPSELPFDEAWSLIQEKAASAPKSKSSKKKGDTIELPPAPKRPLSAYLHFCAEKRPEVSSFVKSLGAISKEFARLWAETSEEDRKPYDGLAQAGKASYEEEKKKWKEECQQILKKQGGGAKGNRATGNKAKKGSKFPKRPLSGYLYFCSDKRAEVSAECNTLGETSKELARRWSLVSSSDRKPYEEMAAKDKLRYEMEKMEGVTSLPRTRKSAPTKKDGPKTSAKKNKLPSTKTKKKRGPSAYMLFCAEHRAGIVDEDGNRLPLGETTKRLAKMWNECSDDTRSRFMKNAEKEKSLV
jgi:hypothetical protein